MNHIVTFTFVKNYGVTDRIMDYDSAEYSSHTISNNVDQTNGSEWVLVTRSINGTKIWKFR